MSCRAAVSTNPLTVPSRKARTSEAVICTACGTTASEEAARAVIDLAHLGFLRVEH